MAQPHSWLAVEIIQGTFAFLEPELELLGTLHKVSHTVVGQSESHVEVLGSECQGEGLRAQAFPKPVCSMLIGHWPLANALLASESLHGRAQI